MDSTDPALADWIPQPIGPQAIALPVCASLCIVALIIPFYYHASLHSVGPTSLILFNLILNLFTVTNAIIWPTDDFAHWWDGNILCDIQVRLKWS